MCQLCRSNIKSVSCQLMFWAWEPIYVSKPVSCPQVTESSFQRNVSPFPASQHLPYLPPRPSSAPDVPLLRVIFPVDLPQVCTGRDLKRDHLSSVQSKANATAPEELRFYGRVLARLPQQVAQGPPRTPLRDQARRVQTYAHEKQHVWMAHGRRHFRLYPIASNVAMQVPGHMECP